MDFRQTFQPGNRTESAAPAATSSPMQPEKKKSDSDVFKKPLLLSILNLVVLIGALLLIISAALVLINSKPASEKKYVNTGSYQAVFLNNGQVYFGKVQDLNSRFVDLVNVYYLTQATATNGQASSDYTLVKLGCQQIHYPKDQMIISRDQVTFWENLSSDGKVAKSIAEFIKQNPNGENCKTAATQSQTPATNVPSQSTATPATNAAPTTTNTTTPATTR